MFWIAAVVIACIVAIMVFWRVYRSGPRGDVPVATPASSPTRMCPQGFGVDATGCIKPEYEPDPSYPAMTVCPVTWKLNGAGPLASCSSEDGKHKVPPLFYCNKPDTYNAASARCYPNCKPGYSMNLGTCVATCPTGYRDAGSRCV